MKRIIKLSKSGFTLLEVLLATVIMVIASTMIMQGFIAVMIMANNNSRFSKSGEDNYRRALSETIINNASSRSQQDVITRLNDGEYSLLASSNANVPDLYVQVDSYSDPTAPLFNDAELGNHSYSVDGDVIDASTSVNNRFAFFYDFGDFMNLANDSGHIMRWGYMFSKTKHDEFNTPIYVDYDGDGLVGLQETDEDERNAELIGYGAYGWYCFNGDPEHFPHSGGTSSTASNDCPYRSHPYTPAAH
jgi:prepilin-type N-terminal cleavage/methylation domain-containing protein